MRKTLAFLLACVLCAGAVSALADASAMNARLIMAAQALSPSERLYFDEGLEIRGMGIHFNNYPTAFDGCFFFPAIKALTGASIHVDWRVKENYATQIATTLASGRLPDILVAGEFGVMSLVKEGAIVPLDPYIDLIPHIVAAVGEERMALWRQADGHIYAIPTIIEIPGAQSVMVRQDWLDALGMTVPETWDEWKTLWRAIRDNDMNNNGDATDEIPLALEQGEDGQRSMAALLNAFGIAATDDCQFCVTDEGVYTMVYEHPRYRAFLEEVCALYREGLLDSEFVTRTQAELFTAMDNNLVGTTMTWAERARISTYANREVGDADALWTCVAPITGPYGDQMIQSRVSVSPVWCVTVAAEQAGKVEDILRLFDWHFSQEGEALYNYGIEGVSYDMVDGQAVLRPEMTANGFVDYRALGCEYEPFGGRWHDDAFMQCLYAGGTADAPDDATQSFMNGLLSVNADYFYTMPQTLQTEEYDAYHAELITSGVCPLRDQTIVGQWSVDEFFAKYDTLKAWGLQTVVDQATAAYATIGS